MTLQLQPVQKNAGVTLDAATLNPLPQVPAVATKPAQPLIKLPALPSAASMRKGLEALDFDGLRDDHGGSRAWGTINNGVNSMLGIGNCIPLISLFTGTATVCWGGIKLFSALCALGPGESPNAAKGLFVSGMKSVLQGGTVFLLPGVAEAVNIAVALKDGADTVSASISKPR